MARFCVYNNDGVIQRTGRCPTGHIPQQAQAGETAMACADDVSMRFHYIVDDEVYDRPKMALDISSKQVSVDEEIIIRGIPVGTVFLYGNGEETIDDGQVEWSSNVAGNFEFVLSNFPYQTEVIQVEVTA
jgi:hypothetical protein